MKATEILKNSFKYSSSQKSQQKQQSAQKHSKKLASKETGNIGVVNTETTTNINA